MIIRITTIDSKYYEFDDREYKMDSIIDYGIYCVVFTRIAKQVTVNGDFPHTAKFIFVPIGKGDDRIIYSFPTTAIAHIRKTSTIKGD